MISANVKINSENRITASSLEFSVGDGEFTFEFPDDFDFMKQRDYLIVNGTELVYDPITLPELPIDPGDPGLPGKYSQQERTDFLEGLMEGVGYDS